MTTPDNAMIDPMPELDIDTAGHTGIRIRGYSVERVKALLDRIASLEAELEHANQWRDLALQFDGHRMQALGHLKAMRKDPFKHCDAAGEFLAAPPLPGEAVLAERLAQLSQAQAVPDGWKLVPVEPTEEMLQAGRDTPLSGLEEDAPDDYKAVFKSMLSAAPPPPEQSNSVEFEGIKTHQPGRKPLSADDLREPKNGKAWRVEWWNESLRMMLPSQMRLDRVQAFKTGTLVLTLKKSVNAHGIGATHD
ncbi:hypothetical protein ACFIQF_14355 [Comamonas sp. J-3]|uniref:hypothetical protein n=1 Tax=Comamonas trifloxystrobinivorans TaxID=3350256 RepID=UPI0037283D24